MRIKNIVLTSLAQDRLIAYENLEEAMNSKFEVKKRLSIIKKSLKDVVISNLMLDEWNRISSDSENGPDNKNNLKKIENE